MTSSRVTGPASPGACARSIAQRLAQAADAFHTADMEQQLGEIRDLLAAFSAIELGTRPFDENGDRRHVARWKVPLEQVRPHHAGADRRELLQKIVADRDRPAAVSQGRQRQATADEN